MAATNFSGPVVSAGGFTGPVDASSDTVRLPSYTVLTVPSAAISGQIIVVSDATSAGTGTICFSNGSDWIDVYTGIAVA